eukprot:gnl/MRDRNA2_/MRDRNA2_117318_c0_seq1.p1 gnl/MRDRNA2_/MRDRNA2_117318_c0~~gnl/MRDRNA2_/MRDRNA2_117318_c0_seq1.p1  ORF type:complete len:505 (+),score=64.69 gnl/MRDRNA2_/MRDRNA2_117318_c0_seq1:63-1577(+)
MSRSGKPTPRGDYHNQGRRKERSASEDGYCVRGRYTERAASTSTQSGRGHQTPRAAHTGGYPGHGGARGGSCSSRGSFTERRARSQANFHRSRTGSNSAGSEITHGIKTDHEKTPEHLDSARSRKMHPEIVRTGHAVRSATSSSFAPSVVGVPDVTPEKVRGPRYNPPDDTYAGTSSNRLDQRDRGLRTKIEGNVGTIANISLQWVSDTQGRQDHHPFHCLDPGTIGYSAGTNSAAITKAPTTNFVASRGRIPNMLPEKANIHKADEHLAATDPITHSYDEAGERRRKGEAKPLFMENREDYNIFRKKNLKDLSEHEKKVLYQRRILAVDNHKSTYRIAGDQDLLPGGTKEFSKSDRPASTALHRFNDKRLLAGFELDRISKRRHPVVRTNMESKDLRHAIYWVGREAERQAMAEHNYNIPMDSPCSMEDTSRPQSAPPIRNFLAHDMSGAQDFQVSSKSRYKHHKARLQENRVQRLYYELIRSTRPHMHHDLGTGELTAGHFL